MDKFGIFKLISSLSSLLTAKTDGEKTPADEVNKPENTVKKPNAFAAAFVKTRKEHEEFVKMVKEKENKKA